MAWLLLLAAGAVEIVMAVYGWLDAPRTERARYRCGAGQHLLAHTRTEEPSRGHRVRDLDWHWFHRRYADRNSLAGR